MTKSRGLAGVTSKITSVFKKGLIDHSNKIQSIPYNDNNIYFRENIVVSSGMFFTAKKIKNIVFDYNVNNNCNRIELKDLQEIANLSHVLTDRLAKLLENVSNNPELNRALAFTACYNSNIDLLQRQEMINRLTFVKNSVEIFIRNNTNCIFLDNQQQIFLDRSMFLHKSLCYYFATDSFQGVQLINFCLSPEMYVVLLGHLKERLKIYPDNHAMNAHMGCVQEKRLASFTKQMFLDYYGKIGKNVEVFQKNKNIGTNDQYLGFVTYKLENAGVIDETHIETIKSLDLVKDDVKNIDKLSGMSKCNRVVNNTVNHVIYNGANSLKKINLTSAYFEDSDNLIKNISKKPKWSDYHYNKKNLSDSVITESDFPIS